MNRIRTWWAGITDQTVAIAEDETGDVPGWVLVTLVTGA